MHPARLFIVSGLPGSGKTTRAIELATRFAAVRMSSDDWLERFETDIWDADARERTESLQGDLSMSLLRLGTSVVIEWGTWSRLERDSLRDRARAVGSIVHLEFLDPPVDELWERVSERDRERHIGNRAITRADLDDWSAIIERPTADEAATYDPTPAVRAGERTPLPAYPY